MVLKKTVFVLGAGASIAYGFPSGQQLLTRLVGMRTIEEPAVQLMQSCGFDFDQIQDFCRNLEASPRFSVDAFLDSRRTFLELGKHAIAAQLLPCEAERGLRPALDQDWMRYLFDKLLPRDPNDVHLNRLAILTFNFDRSFERALWLAVKAEYGLSDDEAANLAQTLAPVHVHGDLGEASWLVGRGRSYGGPVAPGDVAAAASRIKIIFEEIPATTKRTIQQVLQTAEMICFLGFGYHRDNLRKLGVPKVVTVPAVVRGTVLDLAAGEFGRIERDFHPVRLLHTGDSDIVQFLRRTDVVHE